MKNSKKVIVSGLALTLLFSQGLSVDAKGHKTKHSKKKVSLVDKNKNKILDQWEKKYRLTGKDIAKKDYDKDGLATLAEYKLNLNPTQADTNKNGILDGQEDTDKDGLTNASELELGTNPADSDTDDDHIKDGAEKSKDGIKLSTRVKELKFEVKLADDRSFKVEYKSNRGTTKIKIEGGTDIVSQDTINVLVKELHDSPSLTEDEILAKMKSLFNLDSIASYELEVEYFNGHGKEFNKEVEQDQQDQEDNQQDVEDGNIQQDTQDQVDNQVTVVQ